MDELLNFLLKLEQNDVKFIVQKISKSIKSSNESLMIQVFPRKLQEKLAISATSFQFSLLTSLKQQVHFQLAKKLRESVDGEDEIGRNFLRSSENFLSSFNKSKNFWSAKEFSCNIFIILNQNNVENYEVTVSRLTTQP